MSKKLRNMNDFLSMLPFVFRCPAIVLIVNYICPCLDFCTFVEQLWHEVEHSVEIVFLFETVFV